MYFDANWYLYLYDEEARKLKELADNRYKELYKKENGYAVSNVSLTNVAYGLPMSKVKRSKKTKVSSIVFYIKYYTNSKTITRKNLFDKFNSKWFFLFILLLQEEKNE